MRTSAKPRAAADGTRRVRGKVRPSSSGSPRGERPIDFILSRDQILELATKSAKSMLGVSREEAFAMLDRGDLNGTMAEVELKMLRHLLGT